MPRYQGTVRGHVYPVTQRAYEKPPEAKRGKAAVEGVCPVCGNRLPMSRYRFCSDECRYANQKRKAREKYRKDVTEGIA